MIAPSWKGILETGGPVVGRCHTGSRELTRGLYALKQKYHQLFPTKKLTNPNSARPEKINWPKGGEKIVVHGQHQLIDWYPA